MRITGAWQSLTARRQKGATAINSRPQRRARMVSSLSAASSFHQVYSHSQLRNRELASLERCNWPHSFLRARNVDSVWIVSTFTTALAAVWTAAATMGPAPDSGAALELRYIPPAIP